MPMYFARSFSFLRLNEPNTVRLAFASDSDPNFFIRRRWQIFPDIISAYRKLAMPAVDQGRELNLGWSAERTDRIHRGPHRATGVENIVYDNDRPSFERHWKLRRPHHGQVRSRANIVAVHGDIDHAGIYLYSFYRFNEFRDPPRYLVAT
jgi:hypothetical protein